MSEAEDFWRAIGGEPVASFDELQIGEVFLVESRNGGIREAARVVSKDGDTFNCQRAEMSELGANYKVWIKQ